MGCKMTKKSRKYSSEVNEETDCPPGLTTMKRKELQQLCKKLKLKAVGKNIDLIGRIQEYYNDLELNNVNDGPDDIIKKIDDSNCVVITSDDLSLIKAGVNKKTSSNECPQNLDKMKQRDLKNLCKKLKLKTSGKNIVLIERIRSYYNELELQEMNNEPDNKIDENNCEITDDASQVNKAAMIEDTADVQSSLKIPDATSSTGTVLSDKDEKDGLLPSKSLSNTSSPKDWNWQARWCVVDGVLKQDAKERWVLLQLLGGRTVIVENITKERSDFVLEPSILPTPEDCEDNYICGDCVRKNHKKLSGWPVGIRKTKLNETPKSSLAEKENRNNSDTLLRQSFKRKREDILSPPRPGNEFVEIVDSPLKVRRLNPRGSPSPASPRVRRERGEDFQLPKNLTKAWKPRKTKPGTSPKEDPDYALKVEKIITHFSPDEQLDLVFGAKKPSVMHSPQPKSAPEPSGPGSSE